MLDALFLIATVSVVSILAAISVGINAVLDVARRSRSDFSAQERRQAPAYKSASGTGAPVTTV